MRPMKKDSANLPKMTDEDVSGLGDNFRRIEVGHRRDIKDGEKNELLENEPLQQNSLYL